MTIKTKNTNALLVHLLLIRVARYETKVSFCCIYNFKKYKPFHVLKSAGIYGEAKVYDRETTEKMKMDSV